MLSAKEREDKIRELSEKLENLRSEFNSQNERVELEKQKITELFIREEIRRKWAQVVGERRREIIQKKRDEALRLEIKNKIFLGIFYGIGLSLILAYLLWSNSREIAAFRGGIRDLMWLLLSLFPPTLGGGLLIFQRSFVEEYKKPARLFFLFVGMFFVAFILISLKAKLGFEPISLFFGSIFFSATIVGLWLLSLIVALSMKGSVSGYLQKVHRYLGAILLVSGGIGFFVGVFFPLQAYLNLFYLYTLPLSSLLVIPWTILLFVGSIWVFQKFDDRSSEDH